MTSETGGGREREREGNQRQNMRKENRKQLTDKNCRKKVHTKALHSLSITETRTLAMRNEHVTNIATPKGKVNSALFHWLKRNLRRFILKLRTDLYVFIFGRREFQTDDPENAELVLYRSIRVRGKT